MRQRRSCSAIALVDAAARPDAVSASRSNGRCPACSPSAPTARWRGRSRTRSSRSLTVCDRRPARPVAARRDSPSPRDASRRRGRATVSDDDPPVAARPVRDPRPHRARRGSARAGRAPTDPRRCRRCCACCLRSRAATKPSCGSTAPASSKSGCAPRRAAAAAPSSISCASTRPTTSSAASTGPRPRAPASSSCARTAPSATRPCCCCSTAGE